MARLAVMRHAKAEQSGPTDFERPLAERGRRDALAAGSWLTGTGFRASHAVVSGALRTRQTWAAVAEGAGWELEPEFDRGLYSASPEVAIDLLRLAPPEAEDLLILGHNPTIAYLAQLLDDGTGDAAASAAMVGGYPPAAIALFSYDGAWSDLGPGTARLTAFHVAHA